MGSSPTPPTCRGIGAAHHLDQQLVPLTRRCAAALDVGARELAPVIEVLRVLFLEGRQLALDELVDRREHRVDVPCWRHPRKASL